jgi:hypothetical protein
VPAWNCNRDWPYAVHRYNGHQAIILQNLLNFV